MTVEIKTITRKNIIFSDEINRLTAGNITFAARMVKEWQMIARVEDTWVQREHNVPSLFVRLDFNLNGSLEIFNIAPAPSGIGYLKEINPSFCRLLTEVQWPTVKCLDYRKRDDKDIRGRDDALWLHCISEKEAEESTFPLLIRTEPYQKEFTKFKHRSIAPLSVEDYHSELNFQKKKSGRTIYRIFFLYNLKEKKYKCAGGLYEKPGVDESEIIIGLLA